jgi:predicted secreted protein
MASVDLGATKEFTIKAGHSRTITIDSNPTTGYYWYVKTTGYDKCKVASSEYISYPHREGMTGVGGVQSFRLECDQDAEVNSTHQIKMEYKRSWEPEPIERIEASYTITA